MQEQLSLIFQDASVCQRLESAINDFCQQPFLAKLLAVELLYLADEQLIMQVRFNETFAQLFASDLQQEGELAVRLVFTREYPILPPRLYFESDDLNSRYTIPGRDYYSVLWPEAWEAKLLLNDLLPRLVGFFSCCQSIGHPQALALYQRGQFFDHACFVDKKSCEFYPLLIVLEDGTTAQRYLVLHRYDMILMEPTNMPGYVRLVDCYSLRSVSMVMSHRQQTEHRLLLFIKLERFEALLEMFSEVCSVLAQSIIDKKMKLPANYENTILPVMQPELGCKKPTNRKQFDESIRECQEELAKQQSEHTIATLIDLCNKAIEYCTVVSGEPYELYLEKLQRRMSMRGSQVGHEPSIFSVYEEPEKESYHDKLHDLSQVTCASADLFELA